MPLQTVPSSHGGGVATQRPLAVSQLSTPLQGSASSHRLVLGGGVHRGSSVFWQSPEQPAGGGMTSMVQVATPLQATPSSHSDL